MSTPTPEQYFLEYGLYQRVMLDGPADWQSLVRIRFAQRALDCFCVACKQPSVFLTDLELPSTELGSLYRQSAQSIEELIEANRAWLPTGSGSLSAQDLAEFLRCEKVFVSDYYCSREHTHVMRFFTQVDSRSFEKIGQYPSLADIHSGSIVKYRHLLGADYPELARGVGLFAHGVGIGSFVYLRRVFERQVRMARDEAVKQASWDEAEYQRSRMDEKILLLRDFLPAFVVENRTVYSVLSLGIHELDEQTCKECFPAVKVAIELILDEKLSRLEQEKKIRDNKSAISAILSRVKGK